MLPFFRLTFLFCVMAFPLLGKTEQFKTPNKLASMVTNTVEPWMEKNHIPGVVVGVYHHGKPEMFYLGVESEKTQRSVNQDTIFEVGSWTKLFTCLLAAQTAEEGLWNLNDPVIKYLPLLAKNPAFHDITLKQLGTYTAGFPFNVPENIKQPSLLSHYLTDWTPEIKNTWTYSNISIGLLGDALSAKYSEDINSLYIKKILRPLDMQPMGFIVPETLSKHYAQGYDADGKPILDSPFSLFPASWGIKMSAGDALKFLKAAIGESDSVRKAMQMTQTPYFDIEDETHHFEQGLGWGIYPLQYPLSQGMKQKLLNPPEEMFFGPISAKALPKDQQKFNGSYLMDKTGATYGFRSYMVVIPNFKSGVFILTNRYVSNGEIVRMGRTLLFNFLDDGIY